MNAPVNRSRRRFLVTSAVVAGGFAVGTAWFYRDRDQLSAPDALTAGAGEHVYNAWLKITNDGRILVQVPRQEMGQGITTSLPMLVAEELDADFDDVVYEQAPIAPVYGNATMLAAGVPFRPEDKGVVAELTRMTQFRAGQMLGIQATGGSTSVRDAWEPMRRAGATARAMLIAAAAERFDVSPASLEVHNSVVRHAQSAREATFGELAEAAAGQPVPDDVVLKDPADYVMLGKSVPRNDIVAKSNGTAAYGLDTRVPGMIYATIAQCPIVGGSVGSYNRDAVTEMAGVRDVFDVEATATSAPGVVVVAEHYWQAKQALDVLDIEWIGGEHAAFSTDEQRVRYGELLSQDDGRTYDAAGDCDAALDAAAQTLQASYYVPYLAHATMEPINCTTLIRSDGTGEVWVGNQAPSLVRWMTAKIADIDTEAVVVNTPYLGGGFGRRGELDIVVHAAATAKRFPDTPIQMIWSREEDIQHDLYRPAAAVNFRAGLVDGKLDAFEAKVVSQSCVFNLTRRLVPAFASTLMKDRTTTEGPVRPALRHPPSSRGARAYRRARAGGFLAQRRP